MKRISIGLLLAWCLFLVTTKPANAGFVPIPGLPQPQDGSGGMYQESDTDTFLLLTLRGGAVDGDTKGQGNLTMTFGKWVVGLTVTLLDDPIHGDQVFINGTINHMPIDPADQGETSLVQILDTFNGQANPPSAKLNFRRKFVPHGKHADRFSQGFTDQFITNQITGWSLSIEGRHVPEPSSLVLGGVGAFITFLCAWRKNRPAVA
jgi:hypothetical protein